MKCQIVARFLCEVFTSIASFLFLVLSHWWSIEAKKIVTTLKQKATQATGRGILASKDHEEDEGSGSKDNKDHNFL